eukprot:8776605-Alexandrium_andersonii.AAC.1
MDEDTVGERLGRQPPCQWQRRCVVGPRRVGEQVDRGKFGGEAAWMLELTHKHRRDCRRREL